MRPEIVGALERERPDWALVYGDTNSTLARARVAHVEAGEAPMRNVARVRRNSEQFGSLAIGQAGQRFRVSDPTLGQDPASLDRADLREQEEIAHPRRPHIRGRLGEDLRQLDRCWPRGLSSASLSPTGPRLHAAGHASAVHAIYPQRSLFLARLPWGRF